MEAQYDSSSLVNELSTSQNHWKTWTKSIGRNIDRLQGLDFAFVEHQTQSWMVNLLLYF